MPHDSLANFKLQYEKYREAKKDRTTIHQHYRSLWTKLFDTLTDLPKRTRKVFRVGHMANRAGGRKVKQQTLRKDT
jgi:hypothetical protein